MAEVTEKKLNGIYKVNCTTHLIIKIPYSVGYTSVGIDREPNIFNFFMEFSINFSIIFLPSPTILSNHRI